MTPNQQVVDSYIDGFRRTDHAQILACLTDDVVWDIPGAFFVSGKPAFDQEIENDAFVGHPDIGVTRVLEENDVVVAEGSVRARTPDGSILRLRFCDVFDMRGGKLARLPSYLSEIK